MTIKTFSPSDAATTTIAATVASASTTLDRYSDCVRVVNAGTGTAFIRFSTGAETATVTDMPVLPNSTEVFTKGAYTHVSAICGTGTATLYFTNGQGL